MQHLVHEHTHHAVSLHCKNQIVRYGHAKVYALYQLQVLYCRAIVANFLGILWQEIITYLIASTINSYSASRNN